MNFTQTELPGIGKRFRIDVSSRESISIIIHRSGRREIYHETSEDEEPRLLLSLDAESASTVGAVLTGAYYQPVTHEALSMALRELLVEWIQLKPGFRYHGSTLEALKIRGTTGATIIGILRGEQQIPAPGGGDVLLEGDTVMAIGMRESVEKLRRLLEG